MNQITHQVRLANRTKMNAYSKTDVELPAVTTSTGQPVDKTVKDNGPCSLKLPE